MGRNTESRDSEGRKSRVGICILTNQWGKLSRENGTLENGPSHGGIYHDKHISEGSLSGFAGRKTAVRNE